MGNATLMDEVWPLITNTEALAVNQGFFGRPGTLVDQDKDNAGEAWQVWSKPQANGAAAVLLVNMASTPATLTATPSNFVTAPSGKGVAVRDIWGHKDLGPASVGRRMSFPNVPSHDSVFLLITPEA